MDDPSRWSPITEMTVLVGRVKKSSWLSVDRSYSYYSNNMTCNYLSFLVLVI